jgi:hypothetical protein
MKQEKLAKFLDKQRKKIDEAKWVEGTRINRDPGQAFVLDWIKDNAKKFRKDFTNEELAEAVTEIEDMLEDFEKSIIDINKLKKYLADIKERIDVAKETLDE